MSMAYEDKETEVTAEQYTYSVVVRFRGEGKPYSFGSYQDDFHKEDWVVVETQQGMEMGQVQADALSVQRYSLRMPTRPVLRKATESDHQDYKDNLEKEKEAFDICNEEIKDLNLDMHLLSAQYTLDRSKILFVYLADQRVDFRELLKRLGSKLHCRIELRQIGERDKAKMTGGLGMCGMELCCSRFKSHFDVISINMAKNQLLALNIDKLSGMCGKLKCCLKYEDADYREMTKGLPKMGSQVEYEGDIYRITSMNVMSDEAKLENRDDVVFVTLEDLREKAIPRKGVVMKSKKNPDGHKNVRKTVHNNAHEDTSKNNHVSYDLETSAKEEPKKEVRSFGKKANTDNKHKKPNPRRNPRHEEKRPEGKNVTVRTFGKKKEEK